MKYNVFSEPFLKYLRPCECYAWGLYPTPDTALLRNRYVIINTLWQDVSIAVM